MRFIAMPITAVCVLFLIKLLQWPKKKSIYDIVINTCKNKTRTYQLLFCLFSCFSLMMSPKENYQTNTEKKLKHRLEYHALSRHAILSLTRQFNLI